MGNIVTLPRRGQPGDLDTLGKVATLSVLAVELACLAQHGEADEIEITLNGERLTLDRQTMLLYADDMLAQRQAILDAMGQRGPELMEKIVRAIGTMQEAEAMLADQTSRLRASVSEREPTERDSKTVWRRPCTTGRRSGKLPQPRSARAQRSLPTPTTDPDPAV